MENNPPLIYRFFQKKLFFLILFNILMFALGGGIAHYLGLTINWTAYMAGQGIMLMLMLGVFFLNDYFETQSPFGPISPPRSTAELESLRKLQTSILISSLSFLTISCILLVILYRDGLMNATSLVLISVGFLVAIGYAVPPFRLIYSGIGELLVSILISILIPAFSFSLQSAELHRYISMSSIPVAAFFLSTTLIFQFTTYSSDCKNCQNTLLVRLGWQKGWHLHNILLILGFLLLVLSRIQGLPWTLVWPSLLTMPIAVYQVILMGQVAAGKKPHWGLLKVTSLSIVILTAYLLTFTYWTR
jgi:1,4-dihydroxy-2-naphthoate octaprenyltransferase